MSDQDYDCDVVISGGGPVGLGLAIELGQRGVRVSVVERSEKLHRIPKGQNLTQRTMEHMQAWGVEDRIRAAKTIPKGYGLGGLTAYGSLLSGYHYDWFKRAAVDPYYNAANERLPQYATEAVLRERVSELDSVEVLYGATTNSVAQDPDSVALNATGKNGAIRRRAKYLVGCDGSRSFVRHSAGISETADDHERLMALVVFRSEAFFRLLERFPDKQFYNVLCPANDGYWMFFGMVEWEKSFFFHAPVPNDTDRERFDFKAHICRAVGADIEMELDYVGFWDLRISLADRYRNGRIFIAGDAAHSHPPYGGYGVNTGLEDARNLGWKLAARLQGLGGERLLESYEAERRPVFASTARDFIEAFIEEDRAFVRSFDPARDKGAFEAAWAKRASAGTTQGISTFAPHYEGSPIIPQTAGGPPSAVGAHSFDARPGHHLAPITLADGRTTTDALGPQLTLFTSATDEVGSLPRGFTVVPLPEPASANRFLLVRPDGYVACATDDPAEISENAKAALGLDA